MLERQQPYDFKKELLQIHKKDRRDMTLLPGEDEFAPDDELRIVLLAESEVILNAVRDFEDYLFVSMGISGVVTRKQTAEQPCIELSLNQDLGEYSAYMGYRITVEKTKVFVEGYDERGVAQALYYLEDLMNLRRAPYLSVGVIQRKALFSPRMTQSPFGLFEYPDQAFAWMAHLGYDAVDLWVSDPFTDYRGCYIDMRLIGEMAAKWGIDVYIELYAEHSKHPDEPDAEEFYDNMYRDLIMACPMVKGVWLEGESTHFASRDPKAGKAPHSRNYVDNIPTGKTSPGWWPCCDYPQWVDLIKKVVRKYKPDIEVILCTYNWGFTPEEDRIRLIENLSQDVGLMVTWDMFHKYPMGDSVQDVSDYSLCFEGPGEYFLSEAKAAKERGLKLYSIANTSGRTWDFGVVPYEPMGQQWIKRFENMQKAHDEWNLQGILENIHYGFHPSIISELEKCAFFTPVKPLIESLRDLLIRDFGETDGLLAEKAMECFSEAILYYPSTNEDQYGAFRIGPSYPFWLENEALLPERGKIPATAHGTNSIYNPAYWIDSDPVYWTGNVVKNSLPGVRVYDEIPSLEKMEQLMKEGLDWLKKSEAPNAALLRLINLAQFMCNTIRTGIHTKQFYILRHKLGIAGNRENARELIEQIQTLILAEKENVLATIPLVQADSRLGWEASMDYTTNEFGLNWKLRQLDHELTNVLPRYRRANELRV